MKPDQQRVCDIIVETVTKLCASGLKGSKARIQGVIAVTVDDNDIFVIPIDDTVCNLSAGNVIPSEVNVSPVSMSLASVSMSSPGCLSGHKRARHRLAFESPDVSRHRFTESRDHSISPSVSRRRLTDSKDHAVSCGGQNYSEASQRSINGGNMMEIEPLDETDYCNSVTNAVHCDEKRSVITTCNQASSLVIVDSDDEDVKVLPHQDIPSTDAACQQFTNVVNGNCVDAADILRDADTVTRCGTDTVSGLCIAEVVGSVSSWSPEQDTFVPVTGEASPTVVKDDINLYQDLDCDEEDDVAVVKEESREPTQPWAKAARPLNYTQWSPCQRPRTDHWSVAGGDSPASGRRVESWSAASSPTQSVTAAALNRAAVQNPASYKTMYVCNECNRPFAYRKNLVTHQRVKHNISTSHQHY